MGELPDLVLARPIGLLSILDDETKNPSSSDATIVERWNQHLEKTNAYSSSGADKFTIKHFVEPVEYSVTGFREKNRNYISPDLIRLLRESDNELVKYIFRSDNKQKPASVNHISERKCIKTKNLFCFTSLVQLSDVDQWKTSV